MTRRNTIAYDRSPANEEEEENTTATRRMTTADEDAFLVEVLEHFDTIEKKTTDRSLTPKALQVRMDEAWELI